MKPTNFGAGARPLVGLRSRGRLMKQMRAGAPAGRRNPNYFDDDAAHSLAIALLVSGEAASTACAALMSVMLREGFENPSPEVLALAFDDTDERQANARKEIEKRVRRVRDKLYKDKLLDQHVARARTMPGLKEMARAHRDRLVVQAPRIRRFSRAAALLMSEPDYPYWAKRRPAPIVSMHHTMETMLADRIVLEPGALSVAAFCKWAGLAESTGWAMIAANKIRSVKRGGRRLIPMEASKAWLAGDQEAA